MMMDGIDLGSSETTGLDSALGRTILPFCNVSMWRTCPKCLTNARFHSGQPSCAFAMPLNRYKDTC